MKNNYSQNAQIWDLACLIRHEDESSLKKFFEAFGINEIDGNKFLRAYYTSAILDICRKSESCEKCPCYIKSADSIEDTDRCEIIWLGLSAKERRKSECIKMKW